MENPPFRSTWACDIGKRVEETKFDVKPILGHLLHRGHRGVFSSAPKLGKSTYLSWLMGSSAVRPMIYLTEMTPAQWEDFVDYWPVERQKQGEVRFIFREDVFGVIWEDIVAGLLRHVLEEGTQAIVVDTARRFFQLGMGEWNDPGPVQRAVDLTDPLCDQGCGVLFVHHERKSGGAHAEGLSGTSAFAGAVDTVCTMKRVRGQALADTRQRRLEYESRFPVPGSELVTWQEDDFSFISTDPATMILEVLAAKEMTEDELRKVWRGGAPAHAVRYALLSRMTAAGLLTRKKAPGRGAAWVYKRP